VLDSKFLAVRRHKYEKNIKALMPGELGEDVVAMQVAGQGVEAALAAAAAPDNITLADLEEQIANTNLDTWAAIQHCRAERSAQAADSEADAEAAAEAAETARVKALGPHCTLSDTRIAVSAAAGSAAHATLTMRNTGRGLHSSTVQLNLSCF
jgi:hypothetical protein